MKLPAAPLQSGQDFQAQANNYKFLFNLQPLDFNDP